MTTPRRRRASLLTALAVTLGLLTACSAAADAGGDQAVAPADMGMVEGSTGEMAQESAADSAGGEAVADADADRQVIVTGWATVVVADPLAGASQLAALIEGMGGYVESRSEQAGGVDTTAWATLTLRVPADQLSAVLDHLAEMGEVTQSETSSLEVTDQVRDLDARIRAVELSITRLEALLERSGDLADIVAAEQVLTDRQSQLERLAAERGALADQVAMSTLTVNLYTDEAVPDEPPTGFLSGLESGWKALVAFVTWLLSAVGVLLPWLVVLAVLGAIAWPLVRRLRRADDRAVAGASAPPAPPQPGPSELP